MRKGPGPGQAYSAPQILCVYSGRLDHGLNCNLSIFCRSGALNFFDKNLTHDLCRGVSCSKSSSRCKICSESIKPISYDTDNFDLTSWSNQLANNSNNSKRPNKRFFFNNIEIGNEIGEGEAWIVVETTSLWMGRTKNTRRKLKHHKLLITNTLLKLNLLGHSPPPPQKTKQK